MKKLTILLLLILSVVISCKDKTDTKSENSHIKQSIYKTSRNEIVVLKIVKDSAYHIDFLSTATKKVQNQKSNDSTLNFYTLLQFEGTVSTDGNQQYLRENVITNSIKMSNGKAIKAPINGANMIYNTSNNTLSIFNKKLEVSKNLSIPKTLEIVKKHKDWNGDYIDLKTIEL
ncbi:hypothetical protein JAO71_07995 [Olleya sp. YSTF-M6]|uniref:Uncharacterized protein n=1 Tax=Olleya sediminilitoris TaxID=2795739 RepID=A0ABS1WKV9_9FLAO|nr:hypothetical protein [Olleya sediminilitoris]MBL7559743.1 hypothetical protein [Olleya sediminilitoris]